LSRFDGLRRMSCGVFGRRRWRGQPTSWDAGVGKPPGDAEHAAVKLSCSPENMTEPAGVTVEMGSWSRLVETERILPDHAWRTH